MAPELDNAEKLSKFVNENGYTSEDGFLSLVTEIELERI